MLDARLASSFDHGIAVRIETAVGEVNPDVDERGPGV